MHLRNLVIFVLGGALFLAWGCASTIPTQSSHSSPQVVKAEKPNPQQATVPTHKPPVSPKIEPQNTSELPPEKAEKPEPTPVEAPQETLKMTSTSQDTEEQSDQELLDSALEFCQAASDFWEQGDFDNALDALDQAYSLVLKVKGVDNPQIAQQKDDLRFTISKRIIEVYSSRFTVANGKGKVIPLVMNDYVARAIRLFQGQERKFFICAYKRSGKYRPAIVKALREAGLPEELSWLPLIESGFKVRALSRARALGLWQFIASTGYKYGLKRDRWIDERMDPEKSTQAAIAYLKELHQIFGDWTTAIAAYNCGEGTVLRCIRTQHINYLDNFWDLYQKLPMETAFYVPKFMAVLHIVGNPEKYGFELPPTDDAINAEKVTIDKQVHLKTISKYLGIPYSLLRELNPELRFNSTPNRPYALRVPKGKGEILLAKLGDLPVWSPPTPAYVIHRVRKGETLSTIARRYRTSVRAIMDMNRLTSARYIRAGWKLKIPIGRKKVVVAKKRTHSSPPPTRGTRKDFIEYEVRRGDSLWTIARRFGTTTKAIQTLNRLPSTRLQVGQVLFIPKYKSISIPKKTKRYVVAQGDSPYMIAQKHQMNLSEFLRLNNLTPRSTIFPGQTVLVKAD